MDIKFMLRFEDRKKTVCIGFRVIEEKAFEGFKIVALMKDR